MTPRARLILLAIVAISMVLLPLFAYIGAFGAKWSTSQEVWGQFGDFFGGFLNPLYALGVEIALVTPAVVEAHAKALTAGATELKEPETKPWGQVVSYVRCPDGTLVEICSPVGG